MLIVINLGPSGLDTRGTRGFERSFEMVAEGASRKVTPKNNRFVSGAPGHENKFNRAVAKTIIQSKKITFDTE